MVGFLQQWPMGRKIRRVLFNNLFLVKNLRNTMLLCIGFGAATAGCLRTPNPENPVQIQVANVETVFSARIYKYAELLAKFPDPDYDTLDSLYVSTDGDNDGAGTQADPYRTIQKAINEARRGTIIRVVSGTYKETPRFEKSGSRDLPIVLYAEDGPGTVRLSADNTSTPILSFTTEKYIIIDGFEITGTRGRGVEFNRVGEFKSKNRFITIKNCTIHHTGRDAIYAHEADYIMIDNCEVYTATNVAGLAQLIELVAVFHAVVRRSTFRSNRGAVGLVRGGSANIYMVRNTFRNFQNSEFALEIGGETSLGDFRDREAFANPEAFAVVLFNNLFETIEKETFIFQGAQDVKILHNTFINVSFDDQSPNGQYFFMQLFRPDELPNKNIRFQGNLIYNDADHPLQKLYKSVDAEASKIRIRKNLIYHPDPEIDSSQFTNPGGVGNNILQEPVFVVEEDNYSLDSSSPGVNCNGSRIGEINIDFFGNDRDKSDDLLDCGAFESEEANP